jgi:hypothetical protein
MGTVREVLSEQLSANQSSAELAASFASHRARLTELCVRHAAPEARLCVLGAGNANDLELAVLAERFREIHLVDIDEGALSRAVAGQPQATRDRLVLHAPVDLSGVLDRIERWGALQVTPEELAGHPGKVAASLATRLGAPFDVVLSACLLTPLQLGVVTVLGDRHPLFEAVRYTVTVSHLRTLARLAAPGGRVLLATDVASNDIAPAILRASDAELVALVPELVAEGRVFQVAQPELIRAMTRDDPELARALEWLPVSDAWRWQNGATRTFLVYALEGSRPAAAPV